MKELIVLPNVTIKDALKKLSQSNEKCLIVADKNSILLGTLSDGDIRRALIKQIPMDSDLKNIMNLSPVTAFMTDSLDQVTAMMKKSLK